MRSTCTKLNNLPRYKFYPPLAKLSRKKKLKNHKSLHFKNYCSFANRKLGKGCIIYDSTFKPLLLLRLVEA